MSGARYNVSISIVYTGDILTTLTNCNNSSLAGRNVASVRVKDRSYIYLV